MRRIIVFPKNNEYLDNSKYLFNFLVRNKQKFKDLEFFYFTMDENVFHKLKKYNLPVITLDETGKKLLRETKLWVLSDWDPDYIYHRVKSKDVLFFQMWHGIPLKDVRVVMKTYDYFPKHNDYFVSTFKYMQSVFEKIFSANEFVITGYPRNDVFFREPDEFDFINIDERIFDKILNLKRKQKIILITPSLSMGYTNKDMALSFLDLNKLDRFGRKYDTHFILKLHPAMANFGKLITGKYENITIYPPKSDIYSLLKYTDALVTDFSSIFFDYLFLDRSIIFYAPNYEDIKKNCILDYEMFTPGEKTKSMGELLKALKDFSKGIDKYKEHRKKIKQISFDFLDGNSAERIANLISKIA